jgi:hypothetical protein
MTLRAIALNPYKTQTLATSKHLRDRAKEVMFDGHALHNVKHIKGLGATIGSSRKPAYDDSNRRADTAISTALRSKRSMTPWNFKKRIVSCKIQPQLCYGEDFAPPSSVPFGAEVGLREPPRWLEV